MKGEIFNSVTLVLVLGGFGFVYGENMHYSVREFSVKANLGETCGSNLECTIENSVCLSGSCACNPNSYIPGPNDDKCLPTNIPIEGQCEIPGQCVGQPGGHSNCVNGRCQCVQGYVQNAAHDQCLKIADTIGEACVENQKCTLGVPGILSVCSENPVGSKTCQCNVVVAIPHPDPTQPRCIRKATTVWDSCDEHDTQCNSILFSVCLPGPGAVKRCECQPGYVESTDRRQCLPSRNLDQPCDQAAQCRVENSECRDNACKCKMNEYVASEMRQDTCVQIIPHLHQTCEEEVQCTAGLGNGTFCDIDVARICRCRQGFGSFGESCYIPARLEQACQLHEQCYVGVNNLSMCALVDATGLKRCTCQPGTLRFDGKCFAPKAVGEQCQSHEECNVAVIGEVECSGTSNTCTCKLGYSPTLENRVCSSAFSVNQFSSYLVLIVLSVKYFFL